MNESRENMLGVKTNYVYACKISQFFIHTIVAVTYLLNILDHVPNLTKLMEPRSLSTQQRCFNNSDIRASFRAS